MRHLAASKTTIASILLTVLALLAAACSSDAGVGSSGNNNGDDDEVITLGSDDVVLTGALVPFADCGALLEHIKAEARERVGPYGLDYYGWDWWGPIAIDGEFMEDEAAADFDSGDDSGARDTEAAPQAAEESTADTAEGGGGDYTGTNTQEADVDEPDIIKTDGERILAISENRLTYVDVTGSEPIETDALTLPEGWGHELFFQGDRALLFTNGGEWGQPLAYADSDAEAAFADIAIEPGGGYYQPAATVFEIDLSDPSDLAISATMRIEGQYLSARAVGDTIRLALTTSPSQLPWVYPSSPAGEDRAEEANRELIDEMTIEDWIPQYQLETDDGTETGPLLNCNRLNRPAEFSGFDVVSVLSFGLDEGLNNGQGTGVLASGQTVYASTDRFYIATTKWLDTEVIETDAIEEWTENYRTEIHGFSISIDEPADYAASGSVAGTLLNQFSLDEHDGHLRVITTEGSPWNRSDQSETQLVVLRENGDEMVQVGQVGGLGKGESLYSARMLDDVGFAVTFRQIDPFYVLDLADPENPVVTGELKIPGFSTYLHPIGDDRVLGIGQNATEQGQVTGFKLSLFDVSDRANPLEVATWTMDDANSPAEWDHRAFQMIGSTAIVPIQSWSGDINGAVLFDIGDDSITEVGQVTHVPESTQPTSDCEVLDPSGLPEDSEFRWYFEEGHVQLCSEGDAGGFGDHSCERIPIAQLDDWIGIDAANEAVELLEPEATDRIEMCWPNGGNWDLQIQRSLVIDDTLWTMSWGQLQANDLDSLDVEAVISLR